MTWKPMSEYVVTPDEFGGHGPAVLARDEFKSPMVIMWNRGKFYTIPGIPMWYGDRQFGFMTANHMKEFMEIPE